MGFGKPHLPKCVFFFFGLEISTNGWELMSGSIGGKPICCMWVLLGAIGTYELE